MGALVQVKERFTESGQPTYGCIALDDVESPTKATILVGGSSAVVEILEMHRYLMPVRRAEEGQEFGLALPVRWLEVGVLVCLW